MDDVTINSEILNKSSNFFRDGDIRCIDWPLMRDPTALLGILGVYLLLVYRWGPSFMKERKAYDLKWFLAVYNLLQVAACCFIINGIVGTDKNTLFFWKCHTVDYRSTNLDAMRILNFTYITFWLKLVELIETVLFVLRKKENQISKLHVYHHTSTAMLTWIMVKYFGGGMILFSVVINCGVHVIMYSYYFMAVFGPNVQKKLGSIKKCITVIQMIQFTLILIQCTIALMNGCDVPKFLMAIYVPNVLFIFYMFYDFFKTAYGKRQTNKKLKK